MDWITLPFPFRLYPHQRDYHTTHVRIHIQSHLATMQLKLHKANFNAIPLLDPMSWTIVPVHIHNCFPHLMIFQIPPHFLSISQKVHSANSKSCQEHMDYMISAKIMPNNMKERLLKCRHLMIHHINSIVIIWQSRTFQNRFHFQHLTSSSLNHKQPTILTCFNFNRKHHSCPQFLRML